MGEFNGQVRLADTAQSVHSFHRDGVGLPAQSLEDAFQQPITTGEVGIAGGHMPCHRPLHGVAGPAVLGAGCGCRKAAVDVPPTGQPGIVRQHRLLQVLQWPPGIDAEFLGQSSADTSDDAKGIGLSAGAVLGQRELGVQFLVHRVLDDERLEFGNEVGGTTQRQVGRNPVAPSASRSCSSPAASAEAKGRPVNSSNGADRHRSSASRN